MEIPRSARGRGRGRGVERRRGGRNRRGGRALPVLIDGSESDDGLIEVGNDSVEPVQQHNAVENSEPIDIELPEVSEQPQEADIQPRSYFKSYNVIPGTFKTHDTAILEMAIEHMTNKQA